MYVLGHTIHKTCMHHSNQLPFYHSLHEENWVSWNKSLICTVIHKATDLNPKRFPTDRSQRLAQRWFLKTNSSSLPPQPQLHPSFSSWNLHIPPPGESRGHLTRVLFFLLTPLNWRILEGGGAEGLTCICNPGDLNFTILPQLQQREDFKCGFQAWQVSNLGDLQLKNIDAYNPIITQKSG